MNVVKKYNIHVSGKGEQPMLFVHGYGCDQSMWKFLKPAFELHYKIVLMDLMGMGDSDSSSYDFKKYKDLRGYCDDIVEICDSLQLKNVILVGHSVSATIGMLASIKRPDIFSNLVLIGPSPCYFNDGDYFGGFNRADLVALLEKADSDYLSWARFMAPAIMGRPDRPELGVELTNSFCKSNPEVARHFARVVFLADNRADVASVKTPSLILQCSQDIVAPETAGRFLHRSIKNSEFVQLEAIGHCPHISEPEETIQAISSYLQKRTA